jgi:hypothetical protein
MRSCGWELADRTLYLADIPLRRPIARAQGPHHTPCTHGQSSRQPRPPRRALARPAAALRLRPRPLWQPAGSPSSSSTCSWRYVCSWPLPCPLRGAVALPTGPGPSTRHAPKHNHRRPQGRLSLEGQFAPVLPGRVEDRTSVSCFYFDGKKETNAKTTTTGVATRVRSRRLTSMTAPSLYSSYLST